MRDAGKQVGLDYRERRGDGGRGVQNALECNQRSRGILLSKADHCASVVNGAHLTVINGTDPLGIGGEARKRCARLIQHPKTRPLGREPPGNPWCEGMYTRESRLRTRRRSEFLDCRVMLRATGMQHAGRHVQKYGGGRVNVRIGYLLRAAQPALSVVELAHPDRHAADRSKRRRQNRMILEAAELGQGHRLTAALACGRDRDRL